MRDDEQSRIYPRIKIQFSLPIGGTEEDSLRAEIRLGRELAAAFLEQVPLVEENETTRFAAQIGCWLMVNVTEKKLPFNLRAISHG